MRQLFKRAAGVILTVNEALTSPLNVSGILGYRIEFGQNLPQLGHDFNRACVETTDLRKLKMTAQSPITSSLVMIVDDDPDCLEVLACRLEYAGYRTVKATSAQDAMISMRARLPDIVMLDVMMPGVDGLTFLRELRSQERTRDLPVILVSAMQASADVATALEMGASDYVTKPVDVPIMLARVAAQLRFSTLLKKLEAQTQLLSQLAGYDDLTGVYNRRLIFQALENESQRSERHERAISVLMIDLDGFKIVNDDYGHAMGDDVLQQVVLRLKSAVREADILGRYGGDEFCAILPETDAADAMQVAERVRKAVADMPVTVGSWIRPMFVTIGVSSRAPGQLIKPSVMLAEADAGLYRAKNNGRNQVCGYDPATMKLREFAPLEYNL